MTTGQNQIILVINHYTTIYIQGWRKASESGGLLSCLACCFQKQPAPFAGEDFRHWMDLKILIRNKLKKTEPMVEKKEDEEKEEEEEEEEGEEEEEKKEDCW